MLTELLSNARFRLRAIFRRNTLENELDAELRFHLEREAEKYVRAGIPLDEARRRARLAFGGLDRIKDDAREARGVSYLEIAGQNARYAIRGLRTKPGFAAAVVLTLALGIGANAAMFDIVDRLMFRPPRYLRDPGTVHRVFFAWNDRRGEYAGYDVEYTRYLDVVKHTHSFEQLAGFRGIDYPVGEGQDARTVPIGVVTGTFFELFDVRPVLGRFFTRAEDSLPAGTPVVVISHAFWQTRYGGRPTVLGEKLRVGSPIYTIVGVAPPGFSGISAETPPAVWVPATAYASTMRFNRQPSDFYTRYNWSWIEIVVRRKTGVSEAVANADLSNAYQRSWNAQAAIDPRHPPASMARPQAIVTPLQLWRAPGGRPEGKIMAWIAGVAAIVLLIACANVANLQLARALGRQREIAIRLALGVSRGRLFGQFMTESLILALLGGAVGVVVAPWGSLLLQRLFTPASDASPTLADSRLLMFASGVAIFTGILAGLAPAVHAIGGQLASSLKAGGREGTSQRSRTRSALVVFQGALSAALLVGAGLFVRSLENVRSLRIGYDVDPIAYVSWNERDTRIDSADRATLGLRLQTAALAVRGVTNAARVVTAPFSMMSVEELFVAGIDSVAQLGRFTLQAASSELFATLGTRIVRGRALTAEDRAGTPRVAVVSESMARTLWPERDPLGECMRIAQPTAECTTIVGVAEDAKQLELTGPRALHYYIPIDQYSRPNRALFVRVNGDAVRFAEAIRRRLQEEMPGAAYVTVRPMRELVDPKMRSWRFGATMFLAFGLLALTVAAIGLYSVISYHVAQRRHELGVRIALGAQTNDLLRLVIGEGLRFGIAGVVAGGLIALAAGRWIAPLLFNVSPKDPIVFGGVALLLVAVAVAASGMPAWRASRVDPTVALRGD